MLKLYRKSQEAQLNWIRSHPVQYVALNAAVLAVFFGYIKYADRRDMPELENENSQPEK